MEERKEKKYVFTIFFILVAAVSLFLIKSFAISVISAILLAYIFYPLYKKIRNIVRSKNLAAFLTIIIVVVILIIPIVAGYLFLEPYFDEAKENYSGIKETFEMWIGAGKRIFCPGASLLRARKWRVERLIPSTTTRSS